MISAGIKELFIAATGAWPSSLDPTVGMGIRNAGSMTISPFNSFKDSKGRVFPNLTNCRIEMSTLQLDAAALWTRVIAGLKASSVAAAVITGGSVVKGASPYPVSVTDGGLFLFDGADVIGIDIEFTFSMKERSMKIILERAWKDSDFIAFVTSAASDTIPFKASYIPMIVGASVIDEYKNPTDITNLIPAGLTSAFADANISDFVCTIKSVGNKTGMNKTQVRGLAVDFKAICAGPTAAEIALAITNGFQASDITLDLGANAQIILKTAGLTMSGDAIIGDDKREASVQWTGEYDIDFVTESSGTVTLNTFLQ